MRVRIGTSGYGYKEWKGSFYPADLPASKMLRYYAQHLDTVELNHTFRAMPKEGSLGALTKSVGEGFRFAVKAPQQITHRRRLRECAADVEALCKGAAELGEMRGALLFQLPPNFKADAARLTDFLAVLKASGAGEVAFEFRHETWFVAAIEQLLADAGAALCVAESEDLAAHRAATASYGYLRLRNEDYDAEAIDDWAKWIQKQRWTHADVYFKHEDTARGTRFAAELKKRLG